MQHTNVGKSRQSSSFPLQLVLYYNAIFSILYVVLMIPLVANKTQYWVIYSTHSQYYVYAFFGLFCIGEMGRIPFAMWGNLTEQVPSLAAALLLCVFPTFPALLYLTFAQENVTMPFEIIGGVVEMCFIAIEIPLIWKALTKNANIQQARFIRLTTNEISDPKNHVD